MAVIPTVLWWMNALSCAFQKILIPLASRRSCVRASRRTRHWGVKEGKKVGIVGLGGLGHMAVKFAHALGAHVVVFTTSPNKKDDARRLGADEVVVSRNANEMQK